MLPASLIALFPGTPKRHEVEGATVVLELDTSGTLGEDALALAERVAALQVPVIAWVGPVPATASAALGPPSPSGCRAGRTCGRCCRGSKEMYASARTGVTC